MNNFTDCQKDIFKSYARPIVHMRKQIEAQRFGMVFGSGLSKSFKLPMWTQLVESIASDSAVEGKDLLDKFGQSKSLPYQTELLLQHYKRRRMDKTTKKHPNGKAFEYQIIAEWLRLVAKHLYKDAPANFKDALTTHPYIKRYLPVIRQSHLTVTYNFDNYLERALAETRSEEEDKTSRGYETVTNPFAQFRRQNSVVFHPNGFYPQELMEVPMDKFIFSEASYAEQFLGVLSGNQTALTSHFAKNTCLLVGLSLEDEMLRNLLILSASLNPGNYHYYVHFLKPDDVLDDHEKDAIKRTNFYVYNLVTLFLKEEEIAALGTLIDTKDCKDEDICDLSDLVGTPALYCYYMTGPMGVGKSTAVNQFRNLVVLDEWLEERLPILAKGFRKLKPDERKTADKWIADQFKLKNANLRKSRVGIYLIDRPPLDPISFTPKANQKEKADALLNSLCEGDGWHVVSGTVILLTGDTKELAARIMTTGRTDYNPGALETMTKALSKIYRMKGTKTIDTRGLGIPEVTRKVGEIIHLEDYVPCKLESRLKAFKNGTVSVDT